MVVRDFSPFCDNVTGRILSWVPVLACAGLIFSLSLVPGPESYFPILDWVEVDKPAHMMEYGTLCCKIE